MMSFIKSKMLRVTVAMALVSAVPLVTTGCDQADINKTVALIESQIPTAIALTNAVISAYAAFGSSNPDTAIATSNISRTVTMDLQELQALCDNYTAAPGKDSFSKVVASVDKIVTEGDQALLQATGIKNTQSQAAATAAIGALDTILHVIDGYVQMSQSTAEVKVTAQRRTVKLRQVSMYFQPGLVHGSELSYKVMLMEGERAGL